MMPRWLLAVASVTLFALVPTALANEQVVSDGVAVASSAETATVVDATVVDAPAPPAAETPVAQPIAETPTTVVEPVAVDPAPLPDPVPAVDPVPPPEPVGPQVSPTPSLEQPIAAREAAPPIDPDEQGDTGPLAALQTSANATTTMATLGDGKPAVTALVRSGSLVTPIAPLPAAPAQRHTSALDAIANPLAISLMQPGVRFDTALSRKRIVPAPPPMPTAYVGPIDAPTLGIALAGQVTGSSERMAGLLAFVISLMPFAPSDGKFGMGPPPQLAVLILAAALTAFAFLMFPLHDMRRRGPRGYAALALRPG